MENLCSGIDTLWMRQAQRMWAESAGEEVAGDRARELLWRFYTTGFASA